MRPRLKQLESPRPRPPNSRGGLCSPDPASDSELPSAVFPKPPSVRLPTQCLTADGPTARQTESPRLPSATSRVASDLWLRLPASRNLLPISLKNSEPTESYHLRAPSHHPRPPTQIINPGFRKNDATHADIAPAVKQPATPGLRPPEIQGKF